MSFRELAAACHAKISPPAKLLLVFMAESCGDDDDCHISIDYLVAHSCMSRERVMATLKEMEAQQIITDRGPSPKHEHAQAFWIHTTRLEELRIKWDREWREVLA